MTRDSWRSAVLVLSLAAVPLSAALGADAPAQAKPPAVKPVAPAKKATPVVSLPKLSAQQVVEKYVAARGGASAWKSVRTMSWKGKLGAGATVYEAVTPKATLERAERPETELPFSMEFKRPNASRLEIQFNGQTAVQVFDGSKGYKYRPYLGRNDWEPYSDVELKQAAAEPGIDGLLIDYAAKGSRVELVGTDSVEGNAAYKLKVTLKNGQSRNVWIDGKSFLELKEDGLPRKLDGRPHAVSVFLRDYKAEQGLMIPHVIETAVTGVPKTEKITIDSVVVNPTLSDARFMRPKG